MPDISHIIVFIVINYVCLSTSIKSIFDVIQIDHKLMSSLEND